MKKDVNAATILCVEDNINVRDIIGMLLEINSYTVVLVSDGQKALAWAKEHPPDLILMDHQIPGLSGPQLVKALRAEPELANIPVICLTGNPLPACDNCAWYGNLVKPVSSATLLGEISKRLCR